MHLEKNFLRQVFNIFPAADQPIEEGKDSPLMESDQLLKGPSISDRTTANDLQLGALSIFCLSHP